MVALIEGTVAPDFTLKSLDNKSYSLAAALEESPLLLLAFFKVGCPVCQMTAPYIQRLKDRHLPSTDFAVVGISQDLESETRQFAEAYGLDIPILLDTELDATEKYDLTNVPTLFLIEASQFASKQSKIVFTAVSFAKDDLETLDSRLNGAATQQKPFFTSSDEVPQFRPG